MEVLSLVPNGEAMNSGAVRIGDQLVAINGESAIGQEIAEAMTRLGAAQGDTLDLMFFRGQRSHGWAAAPLDRANFTGLVLGGIEAKFCK